MTIISMKKIISFLFCSVIVGHVFGQWTPITLEGRSQKSSDLLTYKLHFAQIKAQLKDAQEMGRNSKPVEISIPTLEGKIEKFAVYSFPVMVKDLADQYELGSYAGVGISDPSKQIRFSVAPNDFQSMITKNGVYEFIDPQNVDKTVYGVHPKTNHTAGKAFACGTNENLVSKKQLEDLYKKGNSFDKDATNFKKSSDKKFRTLRLAISVTGEYTQYFGGTVAGALAAINATMTRVNGVYEKDLAVHLNVQNYPGIIYTDSSTDPYTTDNLNATKLQLQQTLTTNVGNANYDMGHLLIKGEFSGGDADCIGCVCSNPTTQSERAKGAGYTIGKTPQGDEFDIAYVTHEMGHQLGAAHTFTFRADTGPGMEPGSGSTIMGYGGVGEDPEPLTNVQPYTDPYFHIASIKQIQENLANKNCVVETPIVNNPPIIADLTTYTIPKETAFVLTASATDAENDPLTYTWEETDGRASNLDINKNNLGTTATGPSFRSVLPNASPTRYFPKLESVLNGILDSNGNDTWESVSKVGRETHFTVTVRDNHPIANEQQTRYAEQTIIVKNDGPFKINTQYVPFDIPAAIEWDMANTAAAPYDVSHVSIDYTTDNGVTWTVLSTSTPNDGSESFTFPASMDGQTIKLRISALGNVFYAIKSIKILTFGACNGTAPEGVTTSYITTTSTKVIWHPVFGATYKIRYKKVSESAWQEITTSSPDVYDITLSNLASGNTYEVQVASICSGITGTYSASSEFTTLDPVYCPVRAVLPLTYISNVALANVNNTSAGGSGAYTDYTADSLLQINLVTGMAYTLSVKRAGQGENEAGATSAWIDFNRNGIFEDSEKILTSTTDQNPITASFTVPANAVKDLDLRLRVGTLYSDNLTDPCGTHMALGEFEDYKVVITSGTLGTTDIVNIKNDIQLYPNPVNDVLHVTKVSDNAIYKIYSAAGRLVENGVIKDKKIQGSSLTKGVYLITIDEKGKETFRSKFIKK